MPEKADTNKKTGDKEPVNFDLLSYLCFEGGGGKGTAYLGVVQAMEQLHNEKFVANAPIKVDLRAFYGNDVPLFPLAIKPSERKFKGISGTSAGAITSFILSMGLSFKEIEEVFEKTHETKVDSLFFSSQRIPINSFEGFLGKANVNQIRKVVDNKPGIHVHEAKGGILTQVVVFLTPVVRLGKALIRSSQKKSMYFFQRLLSNTSGVGTTAEYVASFLGNRGLFSGLEVRQFYTYLMKTYLLDRLDKHGIDLAPSDDDRNAGLTGGIQVNQLKRGIQDKISGNKAGEINFQEYFFLTGVDLVVASTNMTQGRTFYFSAYHTPLFPVVEAVGMSMNFPFVFKPVLVDTDVIPKNVTEYRRRNDPNVEVYYRDYDKAIRGLYQDGGVLQNFPIHAFDHRTTLFDANSEGLGLFTITEPGNRGLKVSSQVPFGSYDFDKRTVAFNLTSSVPHIELDYKKLFPNKASNGINYLSDLMDVFMYPGSEGQVQTLDEYNQVIDVPVYLKNEKYNPKDKKSKELKYSLSLLDFATPKLDAKRQQTERANFKEDVLQKAKEHVVARIKLSIIPLFFAVLLSYQNLHGQPDFKRVYPNRSYISDLGINVDSLDKEMIRLNDYVILNTLLSYPGRADMWYTPITYWRRPNKFGERSFEGWGSEQYLLLSSRFSFKTYLDNNTRRRGKKNFLKSYFSGNV